MKEESISKRVIRIKKEAANRLQSEIDINDQIVRDSLAKRPLSYSAMKSFQKSPSHFLEYITKPRTPATPAMIQGSIFDVMLLTPKDFDDKYHIMPKIDKRTKAGKEEYANQLDQAGDKFCITEEQFETSINMLESITKNKDAMYYINKFKFNQTKLEWTDHQTKLKCIGYTDGESDIEDQDYFMADIKSAASAEEDEFIRAAHKFGYHLQTGAYTSAAKQRYFKFPDFIHIVIESSAPYGVNVFRSSSEYIEQAQEEWHQTLIAFKYCLDNNLWHMSYDFHRLGLSYFAMNLPGYYRPKFGSLKKEN